ncbi:hypothetical protein GGF40_002415 [Coemansia sp. RSA 1286]|nr:hypothetical protein IWW45_007971 [Coemansia sp. RSA 485]KAJ2637356.1 hypothetical protein GGF40_002415 [Coemansia sp. RSA 1286]
MEDPSELLDSKAELDQEEIERLLRENRALKGRLDELERENRLLKQRNFDLSMRYGRSVENRRQPFELVFSDSDDDNSNDIDESYADENDNGETAHRGEQFGVDNNSVASDNNEVSGAGYSVEESESGRDAQSGTESLGAREPKVRFLAGSDNSSSAGLADKVAAADSLFEAASPGRSVDSKSSANASSSKTTPAGFPVESSTGRVGSSAAGGKERLREKLRRDVLDVYDADRDGSARHADIESGPAKERKAYRENNDDRQGANAAATALSTLSVAPAAVASGAGAGAGASGAAGAAGSGSSRRKEAKQFKCYAELDGHEGAIYTAQYSPTGERIASASFDKTVRIWDVGEQKPLAVLSGHQQSVFDVAWCFDGLKVASAGFDRKCIEWDIEMQSATAHLPCDGLVQCLRYSTHNPRIVYAGDSSGAISVHDTRQPGDAAKLSNDGAMVNTIFCFNDETRLVSGDRNGEIKMWDVRIGRFMRLVSTDTQRRAISHISVVKNDKSGTEYMAVNSYDNVVRVYDRVDDPSVPTPRVIHELRGIRSRNWPIKNAFFDPQVAQEKLMGLYDDDYYELDTRSQSEARGLRSTLFLLTGSAEPYAYLYRLNTHSKSVRIDDKTKRGVRQRLEGHSDRVYAVATHPSEIKACTTGADSTIRLWHIPSAGRLLKEGY